MTTYLDLHVLQTVPPSNVNRDDTGSPKTAVFGGVRRARVSSQAWKRAMRLAFRQVLDTEQLGTRTKKLVELLAGEIAAQAPDLADAADRLADEVWKASKIGMVAPRQRDEENGRLAESPYLVFLSHHQVRSLAELAVSAERAGGKPDAKEVRRRAGAGHSIDIALFGRMVADMTDLNVDACAQVAHAISVHGVDNEFDYFTAVDDRAPADNPGAGMLGTVEFNSSTLYRYATLDVDALRRALGNDEVATRAARAFVEAFVTSMPTGKQNTFAHRTLPDGVLVQIRDGQPVNLVGAFEEPVDSRDRGRLAVAAARLAARSSELDSAFGTTPRAAWVVAVGAAREPLSQVGQPIDLATLLDQVEAVVLTGQPA
jgi:CRISPR system Cascade subunit CasC